VFFPSTEDVLIFYVKTMFDCGPWCCHDCIWPCFSCFNGCITISSYVGFAIAPYDKGKLQFIFLLKCFDDHRFKYLDNREHSKIKKAVEQLRGRSRGVYGSLARRLIESKSTRQNNSGRKFDDYIAFPIWK
jgi:hypothetical protein